MPEETVKSGLTPELPQGSPETSAPAPENVQVESHEESSPSNDAPIETQEQKVETKPEVQSPQSKKMVPLDALQEERRKRREMQQELEQIKATVQSLGSEKSQSALIREVAAELGVDEDAAAKLVKVVSTVTQPKTKKQEADPVTKLAAEFQAESIEASEQYADWNNYTSDMQSIFQVEYQKHGEKAFMRGPEYYYAKAKLMRGGDPERAKQEGRREVATKVNSKNLAATESSKSSPGKPTAPKKWSRDEIVKLAKTNPAEYDRRRDEIMDAYRSGNIE